MIDRKKYWDDDYKKTNGEIEIKEPPMWVMAFLAIGVVYLVAMCAVMSFRTTEAAMKPQPRTYTSFSDYNAYIEKEAK